MPRLRRIARHTWTTPDHQGCVVCSPFVAARHRSTLAAIRLVAASLQGSPAGRVEGGLNKQEPSGTGIPKGSTTPRSGATDGRAARAQCDTPVT